MKVEPVIGTVYHYIEETRVFQGVIQLERIEKGYCHWKLIDWPHDQKPGISIGGKCWRDGRIREYKEYKVLKLLKAIDDQTGTGSNA